ncbi:MAG: DUF748 domain-containing protein [Candidatus Omnitrophota bacterium]|jgi:hypothetical protein
MKKKILIALLILIFIISGGIIYLNSVVLPTRIKSLVIKGLEEQTAKKVSLDSLQFNIFKGLVLRNLVIEDNGKKIISAREVSCSFLLLPMFKKNIIIPSVTIKSPAIILERLPDNSFNLQSLFVSKPAAKESKFQFVLYKINITNANVYFQDNTLKQPFRKDIENLNLVVNLSLPASVRFRVKARIPATAKLPMEISGQGEYKLIQKELLSNISLKDIDPREFAPYYEPFQVKISDGLINSEIKLRFKDELVTADISVQSKGLIIAQDKLSAEINSDLEAQVKYNLKDKGLSYAGKGGFVNSQISGLEPVGTLVNINTEVSFNNAGLSTDKISLVLSGVPLEAKLKLTDYSNPLLNIDIAHLKLDYLPQLLKDKMKFSFPGQLTGDAALTLKIKSSQVEGVLTLLNASAKLEKPALFLENISGKIQFNPAYVKWEALNLKYQGVPYKVSGSVSNFNTPFVQLGLISKDLKLDSEFRLEDKLIHLLKFNGGYLNSKFSIKGDLDISDTSKLVPNLEGDINFNLQDLNILMAKFKGQLEEIKPQGILNAHFSLGGDLNDFKNCALQAKVTSEEVSAYGLKAGRLNLQYNQENGLIDIPSMNLVLYDGIVNAAVKVNLNSKDTLYSLDLDIDGVKIEKLKNDTAAKKKDIAGNLKAQLKLNGVLQDISKLSATGKIYINDGRLWQLNLFQGLGSLLFIRDFSEIVFSEGSCSFIVRDKVISTKDLVMKSNITNLDGTVQIGFDSHIDASLNVQVLSDNVPLTGTFKDLATAIIGGAEHFGTIRITGTLKEPKYRFHPAVGNILNSLKDSILGKAN